MTEATDAIVNAANGHRYVGQTNNMNKRIRRHVSELQKGKHRTSESQLLQRAWDEFGSEAFEFVVLEAVYDNRAETDYHVRPDNLSLAEHYYINERGEYNADKRIVRDEFRELVVGKAWLRP